VFYVDFIVTNFLERSWCS